METQAGLFIKCDENEDLFRITRQSIKRGHGKAITGRIPIHSNAFLQCDTVDNTFYVNGDNWDRNEYYEDHIPCIELFFETIIFPKLILRQSGFNYLKDVVL